MRMARCGAQGVIGLRGEGGHEPRGFVCGTATATVTRQSQTLRGRKDGDGDRVKGGRAGADGASADGPIENGSC